MTYLPLIQQNERMRRKIDRLDAELEQQKAIARQLRAEFDALRNDPKTVERLAREKLGYAKPDETVITSTRPARIRRAAELALAPGFAPTAEGRQRAHQPQSQWTGGEWR